MMRTYEVPEGILEIDSDKKLTPKEVKAIVKKLSEGNNK